MFFAIRTGVRRTCSSGLGWQRLSADCRVAPPYYARTHYGHHHHDEDNGHDHHRAHPGQDLDGSEGQRITRLGLWVNVALASGKAVAGAMSGSAAMVADAAHSVSDLASDGVTLWALKVSRDPVDETHPYGHGRFETLGTLGVAALLLGTAAGTGVHAYDALQGVLAAGDAGGVEVHEHMDLALYAAAISLGVKEALYRATLRVAEQSGSRVVLANAHHHRSDAYSSALAFLGVGGSMAGIPLLDPVAGFVVAGMIGHVGVQAARDAVWELTDGAVGEKVMGNIRGTVEGVEGVEVVHQLRGRQMGPFLLVDVVIGLDPWLSISAAHALGEEVTERVREAHHKVIEVLVHTAPADLLLARSGADPAATLAPEYNLKEKEAEVRATVDALPENAFTSLVHITTHILSDGVHIHLVLEVSDPWMTVRHATLAAKRVREAIEALEGVVEADVHLELEGHAANPAAPGHGEGKQQQQ